MNEMFLETQMKCDESAIRCEARIKELGHLLDEIAEDLKTFSVASTEAAGRKDDASAAINTYMVFVTQTKDGLDEVKANCKIELTDLHGQLQIILSDQGVMEKILN